MPGLCHYYTVHRLLMNLECPREFHQAEQGFVSNVGFSSVQRGQDRNNGIKLVDGVQGLCDSVLYKRFKFGITGIG
jgi:hypothetical protein